MKRVIIQLLICSILYGGLLWAADNTADVYFNYTNEVYFNDIDLDPQQQSFKVDDNCCHGEDHCCNALAHLAGLSRLSTNILFLHQGNNTVHIFNRFHSLSIAPPTPPPTS